MLAAFVVAAVVLLALTVHAFASGGGGDPTEAAAGPNTTAGLPGTSSKRSSSTSPSKLTSARSPTSPGTPRRTPTGPPAHCGESQLGVRAVTNRSSYSVGDQPVLMIQVTDKGAQPCVQDLADRQIVLRVYNGESRVWGSHDCEIQPGTDERTLSVARPVRRSIVWSGLSSQPKCAGIRQRVGAGTYTLYASLSGKTGTATQFTIN